jgi:hypothetical protein
LDLLNSDGWFRLRDGRRKDERKERGRRKSNTIPKASDSAKKEASMSNTRMRSIRREQTPINEWCVREGEGSKNLEKESNLFLLVWALQCIDTTSSLIILYVCSRKPSVLGVVFGFVCSLWFFSILSLSLLLSHLSYCLISNISLTSVSLQISDSTDQG